LPLGPVSDLRSTVIAIGTPKRSTQEVLESARNFVQVGYPNGGELHIALNSKKVGNIRSKSQFR